MIPAHANMSLSDVIELLESEAALRASDFAELTDEVRRIARRSGPADDYEAATVRRFIAESENFR